MHINHMHTRKGVRTEYLTYTPITEIHVIIVSTGTHTITTSSGSHDVYIATHKLMFHVTPHIYDRHTHTYIITCL